MTAKVKIRETKTKIVELSKIQDHPLNANIHPQSQIDQIKGSIKKLGFIGFIHITENGTIIAGHGRAEACKQLGMTKIPAVVHLDLSEAEAINYMILDNETKRGANLDIEKTTEAYHTMEELGLSADPFEKVLLPFVNIDIKVEPIIITDNNINVGEIEIDPATTGVSISQKTEAEEKIDEGIEGNNPQGAKDKNDFMKSIQIPIKSGLYDKLFKVLKKARVQNVDIGEILYVNLQGIVKK